jgi:hypothetical protein
VRLHSPGLRGRGPAHWPAHSNQRPTAPSDPPDGCPVAAPAEADRGAILMGILYTLVPEGRWRNTGKWLPTVLIALVALARIALGVDAPTDVLVGVTIPLLLFRRFTPNEVFPVAYRRGRSAHLDVGGTRGRAIRRALEDQLGLVVTEVKPFACRARPAPLPCGSLSRGIRHGSCSASCTPRATCGPTAGTSSAGSCCTAGWRTRSRSTACGGWSSRRTTPCG